MKRPTLRTMTVQYKTRRGERNAFKPTSVEEFYHGLQVGQLRFHLIYNNQNYGNFLLTYLIVVFALYLYKCFVTRSKELRLKMA